MSSRRLAISSLLCDDDNASPNRPLSSDSQLSRSPALSPQHPGRPYASSVRNAFVPTPNPYNSVQYEHQQHHHSPTHRPSPSPPNLRVPSRPVVPAPLIIPPAFVLQPTPSPPSVIQTASPSGPVVFNRHGRHAEYERELGSGSEFPRLGVGQSYATQPHPFSRYSPPPSSSTSPVNVRERTHGRHTSLQMNPYNYSPLQQPLPLTSSLPNTFPPNSSQFSPVSPPDARTISSQHTSVSLSPTVPKSAAPSGLDVLVQAATEERERIDVHRRLSGGEEPQLSPFTFTPRPQPLSPVAFRGDVRLQPLSPKLSPSVATNVNPFDHDSVNYQGQSYDEGGRAVKRRRSSPEPSPMQQTNYASSHVSRHYPYVQPPSPLAVTIPHVQSSPTTEDMSFESGPRSPYATSHAFSNPSSEHVLLPNPGPIYSTASSSRSTAYHEVVDEAAPRLPPRSIIPSSGSSTSPTAGTQGRRSPPRSKPRPKKPGSAALAVIEKELRDVGLSEKTRKEQAEGADGGIARKTASVNRSEDRARPPKQKKSSGNNSNPAPSNEEAAIDDFFLSAFDSPRNAERQVPSPSKVANDGLSSHRSHKPSKRSTHTLSASLPTDSIIPSPVLVVDNFDHFSPTRRFADDYGELSDNVSGMGEADAELMDELADAAGAATSEDERTEFDDQQTDAMEVDVEDELLSLVDGPSDYPAKSHHHPQPSHTLTNKHHAVSHSKQGAAFDRMSMPPPDVLNAASLQAKDTKKGSARPKPKGKADNVGGLAKSVKSLFDKPEDSSAKTSRAKPAAKSRPPKGPASDKLKPAKDPPASVSPSQTLPVPQSFCCRLPAITAPAGQTSSHVRKKSATASGGGDGTSSRSRSHSAMPRTFYKSKEAEDVAVDEDDDKLYCVCKTKYDEDRVMIACDRCDEWYHTQCVNMPDLEIDLVDQFICPHCVARHPDLHLRTTYKQRCFSGLSHLKPNSSDACHKPSRGAYSKYCSDECGVKHLHRKIHAWANKGGDVRGLWETVKDAKRREGVVVREPGRTLPKSILAELQNNAEAKPEDAYENKPDTESSVADQENKDDTIKRLKSQLLDIVQERESRKKETDVIAWRERLLRLASERAENVHECGWDQRLCFGDEEWVEFGEGVLESYEDSTPNGHANGSEDQDDMQTDEQVVDGEWWCRGKKKCERHAGWQKLRSAEIKFEKESKEDALVKLTTREREIRSRIEDILHPQSRLTTSGPAPKFTFKLANGNSGFKSTDDGVKKGKKKTSGAA
ncbi:hypothetical protein DFH11DRAFT_1559697 [Phellopilus nigrolimitatus]|nr:hypothetical protein DFH11DRAFT_1559697 [Phellopilus nigrolimitatus]